MKPISLWTRDRVKRYLVQRFYTRFHMSLILTSSALAAMLVNWLLLHGGVGAMWLRYPLALGIAYLAFLAGVWLWLRYVGLGQDTDTPNSHTTHLDIPDILPGSGGNTGHLELPAPRIGGGGFGGGGASSSWAEGESVSALSLPSSVEAASASDSGFKLGDFVDLDGEGLVVVALALLLIAAVFLVSGYVIWFAPDILGEAAFGALLAGGLAKRAKHQDDDGWVTGVVKKTWWPFAVVLALALAFAFFAAANYPQAKTFRETVQMATNAP